jgi:hypothetical protein
MLRASNAERLTVGPRDHRSHSATDVEAITLGEVMEAPHVGRPDSNMQPSIPRLPCCAASHDADPAPARRRPSTHLSCFFYDGMRARQCDDLRRQPDRFELRTHGPPFRNEPGDRVVVGRRQGPRDPGDRTLEIRPTL